ncbi:J domain-containing protein [Streptomyces sp. enrichment culture]|uniref:J domain-containing protein n=1 Tax=Streptomyces sp. enrichment culture TaxID=1795815 RepID=UPI003F56A707
MEKPDLYAVLGVAPSATGAALTSAFRARVRELRPDTRVDAVTAQRFCEVRSAYETLRDPVRRAAYDRAHEPARRRPPGPEQPPPRPARPPARLTVLQIPVPPEPPLRAGPVHWERTPRRGSS